MSTADNVIAALRSGHDGLVAIVPDLGEDDLAAPSGATDWDISQVLSHLGSGAEISAATLRAALGDSPRPVGEFNQSVWARWDAMGRQERADGFLSTNATLTNLYESMDAETRDNLRIDLGFLPAPVDVATAAGLRLNELAMHSWDVRVGLDAEATLEPLATAALLPGPTLLIGWIGKPAHLNGVSSVLRISTSAPESLLLLRLGDQIAIDIDSGDEVDGSLALPAESWLRLVAGRLAAEQTSAPIVVDGAADLDLLRRVFPGF